MKKMNFRGKVTANAHSQQNATTSYGYLNLPKGVSVFTPEEGRISFDILPYLVSDPKHPDRNDDTKSAQVGEYWYKRPFKIHRNIGAANDSVVCLSSIGKRCFVCEERANMTKSGADKEETDALKPSLRNIYCIIPKDSKKHEVEPHVFEISQYCFQDLLNEELVEDESNEDFPLLEGGKTLKVRFGGNAIGKNKFVEADKISFVERDEDYTEDILDKVPDLDKILKILTYEEMKAKFLDLDDEDLPQDKKPAKKDDDDEEKPKARTSRPSKSVEKETVKESKNETTWDDLMEMSLRKLNRYCEDNNLKLNPEKFDEEDELREAIADELDIDVPKKATPPSMRKESKEKEPEPVNVADLTEAINDADGLDELKVIISDNQGLFRKFTAKVLATYPKTRLLREAMLEVLEGEEPEEKTEKEEPKKESAKKETAKGKCPAGYVFGGPDWDKKKECGKCEVWDPCGDEHDKKK